jgi:hypothetical protein
MVEHCSDIKGISLHHSTDLMALGVEPGGVVIVYVKTMRACLVRFARFDDERFVIASCRSFRLSFKPHFELLDLSALFQLLK